MTTGMNVEFKSGPILTGESARCFLEEKARVDSLPYKRLPEGFFDEFDRFMERSERYWREHEAGEIQVGR